VIRAQPEGVNPNVTREDAFRIVRDGACAQDIEIEAGRRVAV
jgi:hypothetical protein